MKDMIKKDSLNQSIEIISDIGFEDNDFEKIFDKFKFILDNPDISVILEKILYLNELQNENDLKLLMKKLSNVLSLNEMNLLLEKVIKNEQFIDFIQDLFLEKL